MLRFNLLGVAFVLVLCVQAGFGGAEIKAAEPSAQDSEVPAVVYIDAVKFIPEPLRRPITVKFDGVALAEACAVIGEQAGLRVVIEEAELNHFGINSSDRVSGSALDEPACLVLDRILEYVAGVPLDWEVQGRLLLITSRETADERRVTRSYNVRSLLTAGFTMDGIIECLYSATDGPWFDRDGIGGNPAVFGEMLVVDHNERMQREVAALLKALQTPGQERRVNEPASHAELERKLDQEVTVEIGEAPLSAVVDELNDDYSLMLWIDEQALTDQGISADEPVRAIGSQSSLRSVLDRMLDDVAGVRLAAVPDRGRLRITTDELADEMFRTVIYDVADLTGDDPSMMDQLVEVARNSSRENWGWGEGLAGSMITWPEQGLLVARFHQAALLELGRTIAELRMHASPAGNSALPDRDAEVTTEYFRMDAETANDFVRLLPELVAPGTWRSSVNAEGEPVDLAADGIGVIRMVAAGRIVIDGPPVTQDSAANSREVEGKAGAVDDMASVGQTGAYEIVPQTSLIITHRRDVLSAVGELLENVAVRAWREGTEGGWRYVPPSSFRTFKSDFGFDNGSGFGFSTENR